MVSTFFITIGNIIYIIEYFTFPAFLLNIELLIFNKILNANENQIKFKIYSFLLGLIYIVIIMSRFPLILLGLLPLFVFLYNTFTNKDTSKFKKSFVYASYGVFISTIIFLLFYLDIGYLKTYISNISSIISAYAEGDPSNIDQSHTVNALLLTYIFDFKIIIIGTISIIFILYIVSIVRSKIEAKFYFNVIFITTVLGVWLFVSYKRSFSITFAYDLLIVTIGIIVLVSFIYINQDKGRNSKITFLILASGFIMLINPIGSNNGMLKSSYGMWLILPLSILVAYDVMNNTKNLRIKSILSLLDIILIIILIISVFTQLTYTYRDDKNKLNLNTEFKYKYLKNVYSTEDRVRVLDEVLFKIDNLTAKNDEVLMINSIPMLYYLTETKPALGNPWLEMERIEKIKTLNQKVISERRFPKLFVYAKVNTNNAKWPNIEELATNEEFEYLKNEYINLNYTLQWENKAFAIYMRV